MADYKKMEVNRKNKANIGCKKILYTPKYVTNTHQVLTTHICVISTYNMEGFEVWNALSHDKSYKCKSHFRNST